MPPENANVFLVDDSEDIRDTLRYHLTKAGHRVVAEASTLEDALDAITLLEERDVDVALVDGNLTPSSSGGLDGGTVANKFRNKFPGKSLFSISGDEQPWSDDPYMTSDVGYRKIAERVTNA